MNSMPTTARRCSTPSISSEPTPQRRNSGSTESASSSPIRSSVSKLRSPSQTRKKAKPIQRVSDNGSESEFVTALHYVFASSPVPASYSDRQGNSADFDYPLGLSGTGGKENPVPVKAGPNGDVVLTLTFYRPQRRPIPPETGEWIDLGGLEHLAFLWSESEGTTRPQSAYSTSDPSLTPIEGGHLGEAEWGGFQDLAGDRPTSEADNTFTYRLNLSECLESQGRSFDPGDTQGFSFASFAPTGSNPDNADSAAFFTRVP